MIPDHLHYLAPIKNVPSIITFGILSYNKIQSYKKSYPDFNNLTTSIADPFVNSRRHYRILSSGRSLHDYVPLYFATHTPMQYVISIRDKKLSQHELVFIEVDTKKVLNLPGIFTTDGNAASSETQFFAGNSGLEYIDWKIVNTRECSSPEYKRKKCAEVLIPECVEPELFVRICVYSEDMKNILEESNEKISKLIRRSILKIPIESDLSHYY
jgi:hypothetical protein